MLWHSPCTHITSESSPTELSGKKSLSQRSPQPSCPQLPAHSRPEVDSKRRGDGCPGIRGEDFGGAFAELSVAERVLIKSLIVSSVANDHECTCDSLTPGNNTKQQTTVRCPSSARKEKNHTPERHARTSWMHNSRHDMFCLWTLGPPRLAEAKESCTESDPKRTALKLKLKRKPAQNRRGLRDLLEDGRPQGLRTLVFTDFGGP